MIRTIKVEKAFHVLMNRFIKLYGFYDYLYFVLFCT